MADHVSQHSAKVGVYVGCMWAHEFVDVLPGLVSTSACISRTSGKRAL